MDLKRSAPVLDVRDTAAVDMWTPKFIRITCPALSSFVFHAAGALMENAPPGSRNSWVRGGAPPKATQVNSVSMQTYASRGTVSMASPLMDSAASCETVRPSPQARSLSERILLASRGVNCSAGGLDPRHSDRYAAVYQEGALMGDSRSGSGFEASATRLGGWVAQAICLLVIVGGTAAYALSARFRERLPLGHFVLGVLMWVAILLGLRWVRRSAVQAEREGPRPRPRIGPPSN